VTSLNTLSAMLGSRWKDNEVDARNQVATLNVRTIFTLCNASNITARLLRWAIWLQVGGYMLLIAAAGVQVRGTILP
jgi:hypothetical protein